MFKALKRWWRYLGAKTNASLNERADPKVQMEQAIVEAQDQHRRLKEQAANVIANQKLTEMQLNRAMNDLESLNGKARQAVLMADDATKRGDTVKAAEYTKAAESFASQLVQVEKQVESLKTIQLQATQAADQAKAAVAQNSTMLQQKLAERQKLLSQLDQAKMQEQMNTAMSSLSEAVGADVPTFDEVRDKIEARYAKALGAAELQGQTVESRMLEVEQAAVDTEAQARLSQIRSQLGLAAPATQAIGARAPATDAVDAPAPQAQTAEGTPGTVASAHPRQGSTTRSSRCTISGWHASGSSAVRRPAQAPGRRRRRGGRGPWRTPPRPGRPISTASSASNVPATPTTPAGSSERPRPTSAARAPSSTMTVPDGADGEGDPQLAGRQPALGARTTVPTPGSPATASTSTPGRPAAAITRRTPDQAAILAAASFDAMPPLPRSEPAPPASGLQRLVDLDDLLDERSVGVEPRVGGEQARRVGEQHEQVGADEVGDQRGQAVVVAEADLVVGDGVVLVDDGHHAELEQALERLAGVQVLLAVDEVEWREQDLAGDQVVRGQGLVVDLHQPVWPTAEIACSVGRSVGRVPPRPSAGQSGRDRPEVTTTTRWPPARSAATSAHSLATAPRRSARGRRSATTCRSCTTSIALSRASAQVRLSYVEGEAADADESPFLRPGPGQGAVHAEALQAALDVGEGVGVGQVGEGHGPLGAAAQTRKAPSSPRSTRDPSRRSGRCTTKRRRGSGSLTSSGQTGHDLGQPGPVAAEIRVASPAHCRDADRRLGQRSRPAGRPGRPGCRRRVGAARAGRAGSGRARRAGPAPARPAARPASAAEVDQHDAAPGPARRGAGTGGRGHGPRWPPR